MTILALSLCLLGVVGAMAAVSRETNGRYIPASPREIIVCVLWPLAVAAAIAMSPFQRRRK